MRRSVVVRHKHASSGEAGGGGWVSRCGDARVRGPGKVGDRPEAMGGRQKVEFLIMQKHNAAGLGEEDAGMRRPRGGIGP